MANFAIEVPDNQVQRMLNGLTKGGVQIKGGEDAFSASRRIVMNFINAEIKSYEVQQAKDQADQNFQGIEIV